MKTKPKITLITLNYNREKLVQKTIECFDKQTYINKEIYLVDSASTDKSVETVSKSYPDVKVIKLNKNLGVSGYSKAMAVSKSKYFILVDCDAWIDENTVQKVADIFDIGDADILSFRILDKYGKPVDNAGHSTKPDKNGGYETAYLNGAALAIRRSVFEKIGGYDKDYFIYIAEMDFCVRAMKEGFKIRYYPSLTCIHLFGNSDIRSMGKYYVSRNWIFFMATHLSLLAIPVFIIWSVIKVFYDTSHGYGKAGSYLKGLKDGLIRLPYFLKKRVPLNFKDTILFFNTHFKTFGFTNDW